MAEQQPAAPAWGEAWLEAQRQLWNSWTRLTHSSGQKAETGGETTSAVPSATETWAQSIDLWSKMMRPVMPAQTHTLVQKLFDMNKGFLQLSDNLLKNANLAQSSTQTAEGLWDAMVGCIRNLQQDFSTNVGQGGDPWAGFATFWGMPLDNWRRVASACSVLPGDVEKALRGSGAPYGPDAIHSALNKALATPTLGYTREWQEEVQNWSQLWMTHMRAQQDYGALLGKIATRAIEILNAKVADSVKSGDSFDSLRSMYNLWVDAGEDAYAEYCVTEEFTRTQARLTNTLMAVKRQEQEMVDEVLSGFNAPTRRELDSSHRRLHELEKQLWKMRKKLDEAGTDDIREEIEALRAEIGKLGAAPGSDTTPAKAAPRRSGSKSAQS